MRLTETTASPNCRRVPAGKQQRHVSGERFQVVQPGRVSPGARARIRARNVFGHALHSLAQPLDAGQ